MGDNVDIIIYCGIIISMKLLTNTRSGHATITGFLLVATIVILVALTVVVIDGTHKDEKGRFETFPTGDIISTREVHPTWTGTVSEVRPIAEGEIWPIMVNYMTNKDGSVLRQLCWSTTNMFVGDSVVVSEVHYIQRTGGGVTLRLAKKI